MGEGEEEAKTAVEILEKGDIFFFYRPKVEKEEAHGPEDVQRFYLVLRPQGGGDGGDGVLRFMVMGRKALPDPSKKSTPYWGLVELATTDLQRIKEALKGREYETATRGHRHLSDSRAAGEGVYRILNHGGRRGRHTHLVYKLEYPPEGVEGEPQEAFNIARQASFLIQIKNPDLHSLQNKKKAAFPAPLQGLFGHRRYHPADPPDFLNHEGCEFLLISASDDVEEELGLELKTEHEQCPDLVRTFTDDDMALLRPLFQGTWD
ncbi:uncharacterized protein LOC130989343 [Salvia miltiorrhiza]|uniref:uncharacterized protein LOC130989343 n=1 Tax=Salvia miltiorrhiza TaxID=226208 RepID=UPI0025ABCCF6|nr:uncharacterized protein LOC130989343 [Salvia miltiorrhiza]